MAVLAHSLHRCDTAVRLSLRERPGTRCDRKTEVCSMFDVYVTNVMYIQRNGRS